MHTYRRSTATGQARPTCTRRLVVVDDDVSVAMHLALGWPESTIDDETRLVRAAALVKAKHPECVLLDVRLPDGNGLDFLRSLRTDPDLADTPVVIVSAAYDEGERPAVLAAGADGYAPKPLDLVRLQDEIDRAITARHAARPEARRAPRPNRPLRAVRRPRPVRDVIDLRDSRERMVRVNDLLATVDADTKRAL